MACSVAAFSVIPNLLFFKFRLITENEQIPFYELSFKRNDQFEINF